MIDYAEPIATLVMAGIFTAGWIVLELRARRQR